MTAAGVAYRSTNGVPPVRFRPHRRNATRTELVEVLRAAHAEIGEPFTIQRYNAWRRRQAALDAERQQPSLSAGHRPVTRAFGSWQAAIAEVLGEQHAAVFENGRRARRFTRDDLITAWWSCKTELGRTPKINEYEHWRHAQAESTGFTDWPPAEGSIRVRLGDGKWTTACARLLAEGHPR